MRRNGGQTIASQREPNSVKYTEERKEQSEILYNTILNMMYIIKVMSYFLCNFLTIQPLGIANQLTKRNYCMDMDSWSMGNRKGKGVQIKTKNDKMLRKSRVKK